MCSIKLKYPWDEIRKYYDAGHLPVSCREKFGPYTSTWQKAAASGRLFLRDGDISHPGQRGRMKDDWAAIRAFYDAGLSFSDCQRAFGFCRASWMKAVHRGAIDPRGKEWSVEHVLAESRSRLPIKRTLLMAGTIENRRDECGLLEWRGRHISIQIDHRNGVRDHHRLENLQMLCPSFHS